MILQSLYDLYQRLSEDPTNGIPKPGYSLQDFTFKVVLQDDGTLIDIVDIRDTITRITRTGRPRTFREFVKLPVPGHARASEAAFNPCFLWDDTRFVFGWHGVKNDKERNSKCFAQFRQLHLNLEEIINNPEYSAVCTFLRQWHSGRVSDFPDLLAAKKGRVVFQISGKRNYVHEAKGIQAWIENSPPDPNKKEFTGQCLITGNNKQEIAHLHPGILNIPGAPYTGASLVSFNQSAYESYGKTGKDQGRANNSPSSKAAATGYSTALDWLLDKKNRCFRIVDSTAVFWTSQKTPAEEILPWAIAGAPPAEDDGTKKRIKDVLEKIARGTLGKDELGNAKVECFILGISLNQGRISVRFWHNGALGELITNLKKHFEALCMIRQWDETNSENPEPLAPSARRLLLETAPMKEGRRDESRVSPILGGALMRAIILGTRYPDALVNGVMNRIRVVERKPKGEGSLENVSYLRASILKAWLIRNHAAWLNHHKITMKSALDPDNAHPAYQLGRLFAVYEQIQRTAHQFKLERTIRETMFSAASATPQTVFGRLDRLNKHHLPKLTPGSKRHFDDLLDEIHQKIRSPEFYPASLNLKEQSLFCIGYYHQRHELRWKPATTQKTN